MFNIKDVCCKLAAVSNRVLPPRLEPVIWLRVLVTLAYMKGRTYVRTDVHDVMAIKPNFLTSMGYHIFLMHLFIVLNRLLFLITHLNAQWNGTTGHY